MTKEKPKSRQDAPPVPSLLEHVVAEIDEVSTRIVSFRADKTPKLNLPVGCRMVILCLDGMLRVEAGEETILHQWNQTEIRRPGPVTLCPLCDRNPGPWVGATVILVQGPLGDDE